MSLCGQKSMYVIHILIPSTDRSWLCKARAAWIHVKVPIRGRLNLDDEMRYTIYIQTEWLPTAGFRVRVSVIQRGFLGGRQGVCG